MVEELFSTYHQELLRWCGSMTGNLHTAEEILQETFLRAVIHEELLMTLQEKQRRAWLYRTCKNVYIDRVRHSSRETIMEDVSDWIKTTEEVSMLEWTDLLDALPDLEGVIFSLRYLEGYNSGQISEILSIPSGTVRYKLSSARQHLKELLGGK